MSFDESTPNAAAKTKRTISVLSTPEQGGDQKKNRFDSGSGCDFNYTFDNMAEIEKAEVNLDEKTMNSIIKAVKESVQASFSNQMQSMLESIAAGVVERLSNRIECLENDNQVLRNENNMLRDRVTDLENQMYAGEQYSRRNNVRIFGVPESPESNECTDDVVMSLCKTLGADVCINEIDRSHRTGKRGGRKPRPIIVKFTSYRAKQKMYTKRRDLKTCSGLEHIFINEDLTHHRSQLLFVARGLAKSKNIQGAWSSDGNILIKVTEQGESTVKRIGCESELEKYKLM
ncbi:uncharacterized protein LOC127851662 [Dreissena polymorpha]|uniref:uncharacterized protein LOC127851662 n=1 Tax=Dreissena polymorpha TaxID=45954 RepID=UPI0022643014|nr:uncharacterized protein LOC127851662 [Dreissena polymorpha]